jgi:hypothetical protein
MADPLSLIAAGAAVGGLASKVAEKAWDSGERWLREKFGSHAAEAQEQARENAAKFVHQLAVRVAVLEKQQTLEQEKVFDTQRHPQFSSLLQQTILNAAKTNDDDKHDLLARLVAARLASSAETTIALASDLASDAIARSTRRQLELMALCCFLDEIRPRDPIPTAADYHKWIGIQLRSFENFEFVEVDARHLVAIACVSYDPASSRSLSGMLLFKAGTHLIEELHDDDFKHIPIIDMLQINWDLGLAGVRLTSVGSIVGGLALSQIKGKDFGPPDWE